MSDLPLRFPIITAGPAQSRCTAHRRAARNWPIISGRTAQLRLDSPQGRSGTGFAWAVARTGTEGGAMGKMRGSGRLIAIRSGSSAAAGGGRRARPIAAGRSRGRSGVEAAADRTSCIAATARSIRAAACRTKLEKILTTVGARGGIELRAYSCDDELAIARFQIALDLAGRGHAGERGSSSRATTRGTSWSRACAASGSRAPRICNASRRCGRRSRSRAAARCSSRPATASWCSSCAGTSCRGCRCRS